jgi:hypothetical protein
MRTKGSKNITPFGERTDIGTSAGAQVRHLADIKGSPLDEFVGLLNHQARFLNWLESRHYVIVDLKKQVYKLSKKKKGQGPTGAKKETFVKHRWYAEQLVLLDAINAFETFYKKTFVSLGTALRSYVLPDEQRVVSVSARRLWTITGENVFPSLVPELAFEQDLFHDLSAIDRASEMLIGRRRYNKKSPKNPLAKRVRALSGIFQIRHTLSHNSGVVTDGDKSKFNDIGFIIDTHGIVDPTKDHLGFAIFKELEAEANDYTAWIASATAEYLNDCIQERNLAIPESTKAELEGVLGPHACWESVKWS